MAGIDSEVDMIKTAYGGNPQALNNKDILKEIHKSKGTFSSFTDDTYHQYDVILLSLDKDIT